MNNAGTRGYKTGTFITKKFLFKFVYNFNICMCIYTYIYIYMMDVVVKTDDRIVNLDVFGPNSSKII